MYTIYNFPCPPPFLFFQFVDNKVCHFDFNEEGLIYNKLNAARAQRCVVTQFHEGWMGEQQTMRAVIVGQAVNETKG